jgi:hypothetical protein
MIISKIIIINKNKWWIANLAKKSKCQIIKTYTSTKIKWDYINRNNFWILTRWCIKITKCFPSINLVIKSKISKICFIRTDSSIKRRSNNKWAINKIQCSLNKAIILLMRIFWSSNNSNNKLLFLREDYLWKILQTQKLQETKYLSNQLRMFLIS